MLQLMQHIGVPNEHVSSKLPKSKTSVSVSNPKGEKVATKKGSHKEGSYKVDKGKGLLVMPEERPSRRRGSGVHIEETRSITVPTVHTMNQQGQKMEVTQTVFPGTMPSTGTKSSSIPKAAAQANPVEVEVVTEAKVLETANSNIFHDEAFLNLLDGSRKRVKNDTQELKGICLSLFVIRGFCST